MTDTKGNVALGPRSPRFPSSKFSAPKAAPHLVHRSRLLDELDRGQEARLTLVVGSAGAGKTALLADWVATAPHRPVAWLSCEVADSDPVRFVAAIIEALRRAFGQPDIGEDARELLGLDGEVSADVIAALADDLQRPGGASVLVVDDFHLTEAGGAEALAMLLDYRPASLQLVVASRVDPQLRLHRMRANQELVELREADLSFSAEEASTFLSGFGLGLSEGDLAAVYRRSEGWAAGLQMAAISIKQSPDASRAASRVELNRHSVAGFFLDEVLYRQPPEVVDFMLATSVLDELSVPACTALCGPGSAALLQLVYSGHMFITVADDEAGTYRYHQLIKEVLQAELHGRDPARQRLLHKTASAYLADGGQVGLAARHLLAAGDQVAAFNLLSERVVGNYYFNPTVGSALDLDEVQPDLFAGNPDILVPLATELLLRGAFDKGSRAFALAQEYGVDPDRHPELAVKLAFANALISGATGQLELVFAQRERARHLASRAVGVDEWLFGLDVVSMQSHALAGNFVQARELHDAVASAETRASVTEVLCPGVISQVAVAEGALQDAEALSQRSLASARRLAIDRQFLPTWAMRTAALLALERHDLEAAERLTEQILDRLAGGRPNQAYLAQLDRARTWAAGGNFDAALSSLPAARASLRCDQSIMFAQADELEARLRLGLGDRNGALNVTRRLPDDRRPIMFATIALASENPQEAADFLRAMPDEGSTVRSDLELRLLRASTAIMRGTHEAHQLVREVLVIANRHGFVQTVLDTAPQLVDHLIAGSTPYPSSDNLRALIAAGLQARKLSTSRPHVARLPDPLTEAEVRVLEKLPQRLTYLDMASELHLSLNTVKTHLRHTYMKLGVTSRSSAVKRATSLGLL